MSPLLKKSKNASEEKIVLRKYCFYSALISCGIMIFIFLCNKVIPFYSESNTVLRMDLYHQYGPLYSELYDRIVNGYSLFYSWRSGLGGGFLGNFFNYCCSPFALLVLILGHKNMPDAIALMFLFKAMLASASFTYYINKTNRSLNKLSVAFGPMYAFCSYYAAYSWNIMWTDAMVVFPLVILGIEKIIQEKKPSLFIAALTYTMITNYYMAYMVCILSVLYFLYYYFSRYEFSARLHIVPAAQATDAAAQENKSDDGAVESAAAENASFENTVSEITEEKDGGVQISASQSPAEIKYDETEAAENKLSRTAADLEKYAEVVEKIEQEAPAQNTVEKTPSKTKKEKKPKNPNRGLKNSRFFATGCIFAFSAILCFLLAAFALMPVSYCLKTSSATSATFPENIKSYFDIFDFIANHLPATETTIRSSGSDVMPNVYCGLLTVMLVPLYFFTDKVSGRKKIAAAALLAVFYFSFSINFFNFIWHGFHFPNDLPYRFSFAYSFILLTLAYKVMTELEEFSRKTFVAIGMAIVLFVAVIQKIGTPNNNTLSVWLTILFAVIYTIVFGLYFSKKYTRKNIENLIVFTVAIELIFADLTGFVMAQPKKAYVSDYDSYREIVAIAEKNDNTPFYRTELSKLRTRMDPCWYGYNGVSTFSSMAYEDTSTFMKNIGLFGNKINSYTYYPQTAVFNSLFGLKYIYDNSSIVSSGKFYTQKAQNDTFTAYEYKYWLPIAYAVSGDVSEWDYSSRNPFDMQNSVFESMTGEKNVLVSVDAHDVYCSGTDTVSVSSVNSSSSFSVKKDNKENSGIVRITVKADAAGNYYTYAGSTKIDNIKITADNGYSYDYTSSSIQPFVLDIGYLNEGDEIDISYSVAKENDSATLYFNTARLDDDVFTHAYNKLKEQSLNISSFEETEINGTIKTTADAPVIFTSIPYDESWIVTVDGKTLEYADTKDENASTENKVFKAFNSFIALNVGEGEHTVKLTYSPKGLGNGLLLTGIGLGILAVLLVFKFFVSKKLAEKNKKNTFFEEPDGFID